MALKKKKIIFKCDDELWDDVKIHKINEELPDLNEAVIDLVKRGLGKK